MVFSPPSTELFAPATKLCSIQHKFYDHDDPVLCRLQTNLKWENWATPVFKRTS